MGSRETKSQRKVTFDQLLQSMSHFLIFDDIERDMEVKVQDMTNKSMRIDLDTNSGIEIIDAFLRNDDNRQLNLKTLLALSGGSLERLKRIITSWHADATVEKIRTDETLRRKVVAFFADPNSATDVPMFIRRRFFLPPNWISFLKDKGYMSTIVRGSLASQYSVDIGFALEKEVRRIVTEAGVDGEKGSVDLLDGKEVDLAVPDRGNPQFLIMSSYAITTSSSQTQRANEQAAMYEKVRTLNMRRSRSEEPESLFINVVDGGGWLARRKDLKQLWRHCDYCFTRKTLDKLRNLLRAERKRD